MKRTVCNRLRFSRCEMRCNELCLNLGQNVWNPHTCSSSSHFVLFYRRSRETLRLFTTVCRKVNAIAIIVSVYIVSLIEWCLWKANSLSSWMATMNCVCVCSRTNDRKTISRIRSTEMLFSILAFFTCIYSFLFIHLDNIRVSCWRSVHFGCLGWMENHRKI